jgi:hypothetical protein
MRGRTTRVKGTIKPRETAIIIGANSNVRIVQANVGEDSMMLGLLLLVALTVGGVPLHMRSSTADQPAITSSVRAAMIRGAV